MGAIFSGERVIDKPPGEFLLEFFCAGKCLQGWARRDATPAPRPFLKHLDLAIGGYYSFSSSGSIAGYMGKVLIRVVKPFPKGD